MSTLAIKDPSIKVVGVVYSFRSNCVVKGDDGRYYPQKNGQPIFLGYTDACPPVARYKSYKTLKAASECAKVLDEPTYDYYRLSLEYRHQIDGSSAKTAWYFNEASSDIKAVPAKEFLTFDPGEVWKRIAR